MNSNKKDRSVFLIDVAQTTLRQITGLEWIVIEKSKVHWDLQLRFNLGHWNILSPCIDLGRDDESRIKSICRGILVVFARDMQEINPNYSPEWLKSLLSEL